MQYWDVHANLFSQTSAVQPRFNVPGGSGKSRISELAQLQLDVSIGFIREDASSLTFTGKVRPDLSALRTGTMDAHMLRVHECIRDFIRVMHWLHFHS